VRAVAQIVVVSAARSFGLELEILSGFFLAAACVVGHWFQVALCGDFQKMQKHSMTVVVVAMDRCCCDSVVEVDLALALVPFQATKADDDHPT
jgi:hypothetical protein